MNLKTPYYIDVLNYAFEQKKLRNQQFSLRAFARDLEINSGTLSRILKGERIPSMNLGRQLVISLKLDESECDLFLNSLAQAKWNNSPERISQDLRNYGQSGGGVVQEGERRKSISVYKIELEKFKFLADWIHYALMELTYVRGFVNDITWMANKLGRTEKDTSAALERLLELGLVEWKNSRLIKTSERVTTSNKAETSVYLKMMQKDLLDHASKGLDEVDISKRIASSMTMAIDPKNIEKARGLFSSFLADMCNLLEEGEPEEVYHLLLNLSPVNLNNKEVKASQRAL
jgi:uncharacterized protein (TIGR02147 family)